MSALWLVLSLTLTIGVAFVVWWLVDVVRAGAGAPRPVTRHP